MSRVPPINRLRSPDAGFGQISGQISLKKGTPGGDTSGAPGSFFSRSSMEGPGGLSSSLKGPPKVLRGLTNSRRPCKILKGRLRGRKGRKPNTIYHLVSIFA